jgi:hypothetical protein
VFCYLDSLNVLSLPALGAFGDVELHRLAFLQAAESARLNRREVHEDVFAILTADKAIALGVVKPLYCSFFYFWIVLRRFAASERGDAGWRADFQLRVSQT